MRRFRQGVAPPEEWAAEGIKAHPGPDYAFVSNEQMAFAAR
ncbi:hypothetical protein ACFWWT_13250 [Streptomyces sp. NPDC058676]